LFLFAATAAARVIPVSNSDELRHAARAARPGDTIRLAPGTYAPNLSISDLVGTADAPVTIEAADPDDPPVFKGGRQAFHISDCSYLILRHIVCDGQSENGINLDDGGTSDTPSHHVTLEHVTVKNTARQGGNHDAIKLSGVDDFTLRHCRTEGWAGQAVDMVGCHRGLIERCEFVGKDGFAQTTGPQCKGGTADVTFRRCTFANAGTRALNVGGSTGLPYFRPIDAPHEAKNITVEGCTFTGSDAPLAFVGVDGATVRYNTIAYPKKWIFRILQESTDKRFVPCRKVTLEHNLFVFRHADCPIPINIGPNTAAKTFTFADNFWYCEDDPARSKPLLPAAERNGTYGKAPELSDGLSPGEGSPAARHGAHALP
jgi:hypothetical protein